MRQISTLQDMKKLFQAGFEKNEESLEIFGKLHSNQVKAYLIESNIAPDETGCPNGKWRKLDTGNWFVNEGGDKPNTLFLDATRERVWIIYSIMDASLSRSIIDNWVKESNKIDRCWLSRKLLLHWEDRALWTQRGLGLKFSDGLAPEEDSGKFSLKAWHGATRYIPELDEILEKAKESFAIYSTRWQKRTADGITLSEEWYSDGRVTINRAADVDEVLLSVSEIANRYDDALVEATNLRDTTLGAFEIDFSQEIDLEAFSDTVSKGKGDMQLWLVETENESDFRRYKGVDLHTWDRVFLDVGTDYAYLTVPGKGCINAAPRIATIQGEDNAGKTMIYHDGVEVFG